jgi:hypothetical protein
MQLVILWGIVLFCFYLFFTNIALDIFDPDKLGGYLLNYYTNLILSLIWAIELLLLVTFGITYLIINHRVNEIKDFSINCLVIAMLVIIPPHAFSIISMDIKDFPNAFNQKFDSVKGKPTMIHYISKRESPDEVEFIINDKKFKILKSRQQSEKLSSEVEVTIYFLKNTNYVVKIETSKN